MTPAKLKYRLVVVAALACAALRIAAAAGVPRAPCTLDSECPPGIETCTIGYCDTITYTCATRQTACPKSEPNCAVLNPCRSSTCNGNSYSLLYACDGFGCDARGLLQNSDFDWPLSLPAGGDPHRVLAQLVTIDSCSSDASCTKYPHASATCPVIGSTCVYSMYVNYSNCAIAYINPTSGARETASSCSNLPYSTNYCRVGECQPIGTYGVCEYVPRVCETDNDACTADCCDAESRTCKYTQLKDRCHNDSECPSDVTTCRIGYCDSTTCACALRKSECPKSEPNCVYTCTVDCPNLYNSYNIWSTCVGNQCIRKEILSDPRWVIDDWGILLNRAHATLVIPRDGNTAPCPVIDGIPSLYPSENMCNYYISVERLAGKVVIYNDLFVIRELLEYNCSQMPQRYCATQGYVDLPGFFDEFFPVCIYTPRTCPDDNDPCTVECCDEESQSCNHTLIGDCCRDDSECDGITGCTENYCDPTTHKCADRPATDGTPCNTDGLFCTQDQCIAGVCTFASNYICSDSDPCTYGERCDNTIRDCVVDYRPGDYYCGPGSEPNCIDRYACNATTHACDPIFMSSGTVCMWPSADLCALDSLCNENHACVPQYRSLGYNCTKFVNDPNPCKDYKCDGASACVETNRLDGTACDLDGLFCTDDACDAGTCVAHPTRNCSASGNLMDCTYGYCDEVANACATRQTACPVSDPDCTLSGSCTNSACTGSSFMYLYACDGTTCNTAYSVLPGWSSISLVDEDPHRLSSATGLVGGCASTADCTAYPYATPSCNTFVKLCIYTMYLNYSDCTTKYIDPVTGIPVTLSSCSLLANPDPENWCRVPACQPVGTYGVCEYVQRACETDSDACTAECCDADAQTCHTQIPGCVHPPECTTWEDCTQPPEPTCDFVDCVSGTCTSDIGTPCSSSTDCVDVVNYLDACITMPECWPHGATSCCAASVSGVGLCCNPLHDCSGRINPECVKYVCNSSSVHVPGECIPIPTPGCCASDSDCGAGLTKCNITTGTCYVPECTTREDCPSDFSWCQWYECESNECIFYNDTDPNYGCCAIASDCGTAPEGQCYKCEFSECVLHSGAECEAAGCSDPTPYKCSDNLCHACCDDVDCPEYDGTCNATVGCRSYQCVDVIPEQQHPCCATDAECNFAAPARCANSHCDVDTGLCVVDQYFGDYDYCCQSMSDCTDSVCDNAFCSEYAICVYASDVPAGKECCAGYSCSMFNPPCNAYSCDDGFCNPQYGPTCYSDEECRSAFSYCEAYSCSDVDNKCCIGQNTNPLPNCCDDTHPCTSPLVCNPTSHACETTTECSDPTPYKCGDDLCHECCDDTNCLITETCDFASYQCAIQECDSSAVCRQPTGTRDYVECIDAECALCISPDCITNDDCIAGQVLACDACLVSTNVCSLTCAAVIIGNSLRDTYPCCGFELLSDCCNPNTDCPAADVPTCIDYGCSSSSLLVAGMCEFTPIAGCCTSDSDCGLNFPLCDLSVQTCKALPECTVDQVLVDTGSDQVCLACDPADGAAAYACDANIGCKAWTCSADGECVPAEHPAPGCCVEDQDCLPVPCTAARCDAQLGICQYKDMRKAEIPCDTDANCPESLVCSTTIPNEPTTCQILHNASEWLTVQPWAYYPRECMSHQDCMDLSVWPAMAYCYFGEGSSANPTIPGICLVDYFRPLWFQGTLFDDCIACADSSACAQNYPIAYPDSVSQTGVCEYATVLGNYYCRTVVTDDVASLACDDVADPCPTHDAWCLVDTCRADVYQEYEGSALSMCFPADYCTDPMFCDGVLGDCNDCGTRLVVVLEDGTVTCGGCTLDSDCGAGLNCTDTGDCTCETDADCPRYADGSKCWVFGPLCTCIDDADCNKVGDGSRTCGDYGQCTCTSDSQCDDGRLETIDYCNADIHYCNYAESDCFCTDDAMCETCDPGTWCLDTLQCSCGGSIGCPDDYYCHEDSGYCLPSLACTEDAQCKDAFNDYQAVCDGTKCVMPSAGCSDPTPYKCSDNLCHECCDDVDCPGYDGTCNSTVGCRGLQCIDISSEYHYCCTNDGGYGSDCAEFHCDVSTGLLVLDVYTGTEEICCVDDADCPDDGDSCTAEYCDIWRLCSWSVAPGYECCTEGNCDDENSCTTDVCLADHTCTNTLMPEGDSCDSDGNDCTMETCDAAGVCTLRGDKIGQRCYNSTDACVPYYVYDSTCTCSTPVWADAGTECQDPTEAGCTTYSCDGSGSCQMHYADDGTACDKDGEYCTVGTCSAGLCNEITRTCDDYVECTQNVCNETADGCAYPPYTTDDCCATADDCEPDPCFRVKECNSIHECVYESIAGCCTLDSQCPSPSNPCRMPHCDLATRTCDPAYADPAMEGMKCYDSADGCEKYTCSGPTCAETYFDYGTLCTWDDDLFCTDNNGACNGYGTCTLPVHVCADANPCTKDSCDETLDSCVFDNRPMGYACDSDTNECTTQTCDGFGVCDTNNVDDGAACDDGDGKFCTVGKCMSGACEATDRECDGDMDPVNCKRVYCDEDSNGCTMVDMACPLDDPYCNYECNVSTCLPTSIKDWAMCIGNECIHTATLSNDWSCSPFFGNYHCLWGTFVSDCLDGCEPKDGVPAYTCAPTLDGPKCFYEVSMITSGGDLIIKDRTDATIIKSYLCDSLNLYCTLPTFIPVMPGATWGTCAYTAKTCDDGDECTYDCCDEVGDHCLYPTIPGCTTHECESDAECDDSDSCTADTCDMTTYTCSHADVACPSWEPECAFGCSDPECVAIPNGVVACDGEECTRTVWPYIADGWTPYSGGFSKGVSQSCTTASDCVEYPYATMIVCSSDGPTCIYDVHVSDIPFCRMEYIDPVCGDYVVTSACDAIQNDDRYCTVPVCSADPAHLGVCVLQQRTCDDNDPCTDDCCVEADQACVHTPIPGCTYECSTALDCFDDNVYTRDACDYATHMCLPHDEVHCDAETPCDDGDAHTWEVCDLYYSKCVMGIAGGDSCAVDADCYTGTFWPAVCGGGYCSSNDERGGYCEPNLDCISKYTPSIAFACERERCVEKSDWYSGNYPEVTQACYTADQCDDGWSSTFDYCDYDSQCRHWFLEESCIDVTDCDDENNCTINYCGDDSLCWYDSVPGCCISDSWCNDGDLHTRDMCRSCDHTCVYVPISEGYCESDSECYSESECAVEYCDEARNVCIRRNLPDCCVAGDSERECHSDACHNYECQDGCCVLIDPVPEGCCMDYTDCVPGCHEPGTEINICYPNARRDCVNNVCVDVADTCCVPGEWCGDSTDLCVEMLVYDDDCDCVPKYRDPGYECKTSDDLCIQNYECSAASVPTCDPIYQDPGFACDSDSNPCTTQYCDALGECKTYNTRVGSWCGDSTDPCIEMFVYDDDCDCVPQYRDPGYQCGVSDDLCIDNYECNATHTCDVVYWPTGYQCKISDGECTENYECTASHSCDPIYWPPGYDCTEKDTTVCTDYHCDGSGVCDSYNANEGGMCEDPDFTLCTDYICRSGVCTLETNHEGLYCEDPDQTLCTDYKCSGPLCARYPKTAGTPCESDSDTCTADECDMYGYCEHLGLDCDDGQTCTWDLCNQYEDSCLHGTIYGCCLKNSDCADSNTCTTDTCDMTTHLCKHTWVPGCTCTGNTGSKTCNDGNPCTTDNCVKKQCKYSNVTGCCTTNAQCDDGLFCTLDYCGADHKCAHTYMKDCCTSPDDLCDDHDNCTRDHCAATIKTCIHNTIPNCGECLVPSDCPPCTDPCVMRTCVGGKCGCGARDPECCTSIYDLCDDGVKCTKDICDAVNKRCVHNFIDHCCYTDADCVDSCPCTKDYCDPTTDRCVNDLNPICCESDLQCGDGDLCTLDTCLNYVCHHALTYPGCCTSFHNCSDGILCTVDTCVSGHCSNVLDPACCTTDSQCTDGDSCTTDRCDSILHKCTHTRVSWNCMCSTHADCAYLNDASTCTAGACTRGVCVKANLCDDGNKKTMDVCTDGTCSHIAPRAEPEIEEDGGEYSDLELQAQACSESAKWFEEQNLQELIDAGWNFDPSLFVCSEWLEGRDGDDVLLSSSLSPLEFQAYLDLVGEQIYEDVNCGSDDEPRHEDDHHHRKPVHHFGMPLWFGPCDDHNPCTVDTCNPYFDSHHHDHDHDVRNIDNFANDEHGWWWEQPCVHIRKNCGDENECTSDFCHHGECMHKDHHCPSDVTQTCVDYECFPGDGLCYADTRGECDAGINPEFGLDACMISTCSDGQWRTMERDCNDLIPCTTDTCVHPIGVCLHTFKDCADQNMSTNDYCSFGQCTHNYDARCVAADMCHTAAYGTTSCVYGTVNCDDNNPCTEDSCDPAIGCVHEQKDCHSRDPCHVAMCDPSDGKCVVLDKTCDDGNRCTIDYCDFEGVCHNDNKTCDDEEVCTRDLCNRATGECAHVWDSCDDGDACTLDNCAPGIGCENVPLPCLGVQEDPCFTRVCDSGTGETDLVERECHDGNLCTFDFCRDDECHHVIPKFRDEECCGRGRGHGDVPDDERDCAGCKSGECMEFACLNEQTGDHEWTPLADGTRCNHHDKCDRYACDGRGYCALKVGAPETCPVDHNNVVILIVIGTVLPVVVIVGCLIGVLAGTRRRREE